MGSSSWLHFGSSRAQQPARGRIGDKDFPSTEELLLPGSLGVSLGIFVLYCLVPRMQKGIEDEIWVVLRKVGSKPGREEQRSQGVGRVCSRKGAEIHVKEVLKVAKDSCWDGAGPSPPQPKLTPGVLSVGVQLTIDQYSATCQPS